VLSDRLDDAATGMYLALWKIAQDLDRLTYDYGYVLGGIPNNAHNTKALGKNLSQALSTLANRCIEARQVYAERLQETVEEMEPKEDR